MNLRVLQWNVWIKEDPVKVANEILRIKPDVICAQELKQNLVDGLDTPKVISEIIKYNFFYKEAVTWNNRQDITSQGNAIFSKYPIITSDFRFLRPFNHNPKNATKEGRVYSEINIKVGSQLITIGTVHLPYSYKFRNTKIRKEEADKLCQILKNNKGNFVFAGDLNATPESYTVKAILKNTDLKHVGPEFASKTWPTKPFNYHGFKEDKLNWRIDYIFVSKDIKLVTSKIIKTKVSDHLPILAEIEV